MPAGVPLDLLETGNVDAFAPLGPAFGVLFPPTRDAGAARKQAHGTAVVHVRYHARIRLVHIDAGRAFLIELMRAPEERPRQRLTPAEPVQRGQYAARCPFHGLVIGRHVDVEMPALNVARAEIIDPALARPRGVIEQLASAHTLGREPHQDGNAFAGLLVFAGQCPQVFHEGVARLEGIRAFGVAAEIEGESPRPDFEGFAVVTQDIRAHFGHFVPQGRAAHPVGVRFREVALQGAAGIAIGRAEIGVERESKVAGGAQRRLERVRVLLHAPDVVGLGMLDRADGVAAGRVQQLIARAGLINRLHAEPADLHVDDGHPRFRVRGQVFAVPRVVRNHVAEGIGVGFPVARNELVGFPAELRVQSRAHLFRKRHEFHIIDARIGRARVGVELFEHEVLVIQVAPLPQHFVEHGTRSHALGAFLAGEPQGDPPARRHGAHEHGMGTPQVEGIRELRQASLSFAVAEQGVARRCIR